MNNLLICKGKSRNSCSFLAFLLFTFLLVAPTAAQTLKENNITLRVQNEPVENVFNKISEQTNFKFIYDQETVNNAPHVSFDVKNATLKQILGVITTQSKLYFNRTDNTIAVSKQPLKEESAQRTRTVQGVVVDDKGEPVIGASVQIKGEGSGTITDIDGRYSLMNVPESATLTISYIGYKTVNISAKDKNTAKITLVEDSKMIDEVVVVGYGVQRKRDVSTSISSVKAEQIADVSASDFRQALAGKMPGDTQEKKFANLRTAYGFMMGHPGKKLLFMGQDFGQMDEWNEKASLEWGLLKYDIHSQMKDYVKALNHLYRTQPALYRMDYEPEGFEWINCTYNDENIVIFERKTEKPEETLLFVCNFAPVEHEKFRLGVPFAGKYKEILNSDAKQFGGSGMVNPRVKMSKKEEWDTRKNSIAINLAPMSTAVFSCTPYEEEAEPEKKKTAEKRKRPARQPSVKLPASPLDVISEKVGQIIKTARESRH